MTSVVTFSQARCVSCDVARADGRAFSLRAVNRMFSFAAFFTARVTVCVIRYDLLRVHTMRRRIGDRSAGGSVPIPSQLDRARTRFSTKIGSITSQVNVQLNSTMCLISGTLRSTPLSWLPVLDVPHCRILSPNKTEWQLISATLCG